DDDCIITRLEKGGGLGFKIDDALLSRLKKAGASRAVLAALRQEKNTGDVPALDPRKDSIMVWVNAYHSDRYCPLQSEMFVNGQIIDTFSSAAQKSIGKHLKMGWNTITLKTTLKEPA